MRKERSLFYFPTGDRSSPHQKAIALFLTRRRLLFSSPQGDRSPEQDLFDVIRLRRALQELLNCDVDIVHSTALHHTIEKEILASAISL